MPKLTPSDLRPILAAERADALAASEASKLSDERRKALNYYQGDVTEDMPTIKGRSKVVSNDVADTIDGMMPTLMEIFCGSDEPVKFAPVGPEDVEAAEQETGAVNHEFMQRNPGFTILYQYIKDSLLSKLAIVKTFNDELEHEERETYEGQSVESLALLLQSKEGYEVVEHSEYKDKETGEPLHDVTLEAVHKRKYTRVENVPPEEFGVSRKTKLAFFKECPYCFHEVETTEAKLIEEGYDAEQVKKLPSYPTEGRNSEAEARDTVDETTEGAKDNGTKTGNRALLKTEHYIRMDYEGKGKVCLYRVTTGGEDSEILQKNGEPDIIKQDMLPFSVMTPVIMPHRLIGRSVADLVMEIMRINTALLRGGLDNLYLALNPRAYVAENLSGEKTLDDLLVSRPGGVVRGKAPGAVEYLQHPDVGAHIFPMLEYQAQRKEMLTGVTRQGQGLDAESLVNETATKAKQMFSMAQARVRLIARVLAETGIKDMFGQIHACMRKSGRKEETIRLRNKWVPINPREWRLRNDFTIDVGLGNGGKAEQLSGLQFLGNLQKEMVLGGFGGLIVSADQVYNTGKAACRVLEVKDPGLYFKDPQGQEPAPQEDPKLQIEREKIAADKEKTAMDAQAKQQELASKAEIERIQAEADVATQRMKVESEIVLAREKFALEAELKREEHAMKMRELGAQLEFKERDAQIREREAESGQERAKEQHGLKMEQMKEANRHKSEARSDA